MTLLGLRVLPSRPSPCWRGSATSATRGRGLGGRCRHPRSATSPCMCVDHVLSKSQCCPLPSRVLREPSEQSCGTLPAYVNHVCMSLATASLLYAHPRSCGRLPRSSACCWCRPCGPIALSPPCRPSQPRRWAYPPSLPTPCHWALLWRRYARSAFFPDTRTTTTPFPLPSPLT